MKILVTGATGMVGRNIVENPKIKAATLLVPTSDEMNLSSYESTIRYLKSNTPDFIIHCAGRVGGIQANIKNPVSFLVDNLDMGRNIVLGAREVGVRQLLNLGSSCMYPKDHDGKLSEEMILDGKLEPTNEGYALAKIATQKLCEYISKETPELHYKTIIPCNLFGRYDKFDLENAHMIPAVIRRMHEAKLTGSPTIEMWGDGTARREFMYVGDLVDFIVFAIDRFENMPSLLNVGLGFDYSINEYYRGIANAIGYEGKFVHNLARPIGMKRKLVDVEKLAIFGWKSPTDLTTGIRRTYDYMLKSAACV